MGLFDKMKEPVFLKEHSDAVAQLEKLQALEPQLNSEGQTKIRQEIKCLEYGIAGEKNIAFELKNSHMPICILHDIYLEDGELSAQIDYLVFTKKMCFVIECKNLYGDIEINNTGDFVRTIDFGGKKKKEGIYSPITQNQRHLELMKKIKTDKMGNIFTKFLYDRGFENANKSIVVLANPKTILNAKYATKEVKEKVIRADQLVRYIKDVYNKSKEAESSEDRLMAWANSYLQLHKEVEKDYTSKYEKYKVITSEKQSEEVMLEEVATAIMEETVMKKEVDSINIKEVGMKNETASCNIEETEIFKELRAYRLAKSREEKIKPYFIYNDNQLKDLITKMPKTTSQLQTVAGFGEAKTNKYGDDILLILSKYLN